jgi:phosphonate transport system substrate-binding protein
MNTLDFPNSSNVKPATLRRLLLPLIACWLAWAAPAVRAADPPLVLAIHPYLPVPEIHTRFGPFAEYLARELGRPVSIRVGGSYEQHNAAIGKDQVDIAFLGPVSYLHVVRQFGPKPLLARLEIDGKSSLFGVIVVRKDSALQGLAALKDARFAFGDAESTMSHIVPRYMLIKAGIPQGAPARHKFLGSHKNVALAVLAGDYEAGAMKKDVFDEFEAKGLRALAVTPGVPDHVFVARANLPRPDVERIRQAMLRLKDQPSGAALLDQIQKGLTALGPVQDGDFAELRGMVRAVEAAAR